MTVGAFPPLHAGGGENMRHRVTRQLLLNVRIPAQISFQRFVERFRRAREAALAIRFENDLFCRFVDKIALMPPSYSRTDHQQSRQVNPTMLPLSRTETR